MGIFDFFKKKDPLHEYLDGFFKDMIIVDVIIAEDIPLISVNGKPPQSADADYFFSNCSGSGRRINSFSPDIDVIFWIFDAFFVFELNATKEDTRQFFVTTLVGNATTGIKGLDDRRNAMESAIRIMRLRTTIDDELMEIIIFRYAFDFFTKNHDKFIAILKSKYA